ncbi:MAG TPA: ATPase, T2SS/T4P/T4SS family, partial [Pontiella sp.]
MKARSLIECVEQIHPIDPEIFAAAEKESTESNLPIEKLLVNQGVISETDLVLATARYLDMRPISLSEFSTDPSLMDLLPKEKWNELKALPIYKLGTHLTLAMADPFNIMTREAITSATQLELVPVVALESEINNILKALQESASQSLDDILKDMAEHGDVEEIESGIRDDENIDDMAEHAGDAPVIRIVNSILIEALRKGTSDIHIEPMERHVRLRNRIDGILYESPSPPKNMQNAIVSRLKIMSALDIAERRIPQDGRFKIKAIGKE